LHKNNLSETNGAFSSIEWPRHWKSKWRHFAAVTGPGIVVMLADTNAGSIVTAA
jgi:Mn2+/Fe2+ NRAMP family transporter